MCRYVLHRVCCSVVAVLLQCCSSVLQYLIYYLYIQVIDILLLFYTECVAVLLQCVAGLLQHVAASYIYLYIQVTGMLLLFYTGCVAVLLQCCCSMLQRLI